MTKKITFLIAVLFISLTQAQQNPISKPISLEIGNRFTIQSTALNEERSILIHLPSDYENSSKEYPVIYVLDGNNHFYHASIATTILEENEKIPESIIVAIPNNSGTRGRDLARERANFMKFIKSEVLPFVKKNYRINDHRTIFGHSLAGAFVLNYLVTEPGLFDNYIAASPVIQIMSSKLLTQFHDFFKTNQNLEKSLYFTLTEVEAEGERATIALNKFVKLLEEEAPKSLSWKYDFIDNQIHMTTPYLTFYQGLVEVNNSLTSE